MFGTLVHSAAAASPRPQPKVVVLLIGFNDLWDLGKIAPGKLS